LSPRSTYPYSKPINPRGVLIGAATSCASGDANLPKIGGDVNSMAMMVLDQIGR
jgi:hypothetical protein